MKCEICGRPLPGYEKMYDTLAGLICESCYRQTLQTAPESIFCSLCGREIPPGGEFAPLRDGPCCHECFSMAFTDEVQPNWQSQAIPRFLLITAALGAILLLAYGIEQGRPLLAAAEALGYAALFAGLSRLVAAAEAYLAKGGRLPR